MIKVGDHQEINLCDQIPGLRYLGLDDASSSPQFTNQYQDTTGTDGSPFVGQTFAKRTFSEKFWLSFGGYEDLVLAKHELYRLFGSRKLVRVRTDTSPGKVYFGIPTPFDIAPISAGSNNANFSISFDVPNGYRYSLYRSDVLPSTTDGWQFGMNLPDQLPSYHFTSTSFEVYNASDIAIDPYYQRHDLRVTCKFNGNSLKLTNTANGSVWTYSKSNDGSHQIVLDGINTYLDGNLANVNTDYGTISLDPGWNSFTATGASSVDVTFSFPFIYLS
jgi:hypothetical protein